VPVVEAPAIEREYGLRHGGTALLILTTPQIAGALLEARILLWAHRGHARRWLVGSLLALAGAATLAAVAPNAWILGLALTLARPRRPYFRFLRVEPPSTRRPGVQPARTGS
jgi:hypothetical protein